MTGCRSHGELIGGYVLGALAPGEMDEMRRHLAGCRRCAAEERALAGLPGLLDRTQAEETVAALSPRLEDAVLDRFVRERAERSGPRPGWRRFALPALAAGAAAIVLGLVLLLPGGTDRAYARAELWSTPAGGGAAGMAEAAQVAAGTRVDLRARDLPARRGAVFELWCVRADGRWVSGGTFHARSDGSASAQLTAAVKPGDYHVVVVTRRAPDGERGAEVLRGHLVY